MPATVALHETVAMPEPVTLLGVIVPQVSPDGTASVKPTDPAKWFSEATVIVEVAEFPAFRGAGDVAIIVKSRYWNRATAEWTKDPLVPIRVSV